MYKKGLLIYNGKSGQTTGMKKINEVAGILSEGIEEFTLIHTKKSGDAERIAKERGKDYDIVILLGGDGTVHEGVNGLATLDNPPIIGILPGGTSNDFAKGINMPQKLNNAAKTIIEGKTSKIDIGKVNDRYFTNFFGVGLVTKISEGTDKKTKDLMGRVSYYISAIRNMRDEDTFEFTLETNESTIEDEAAMVIAINGNFVGSIEVPKKDISMEDKLLDIFIIYKAGVSLILKYLTQKETLEENIENEQIKHIQASEFKLTTKEDLKVDTDGEVYMKTPAKVSLKEKNLTFIVGNTQEQGLLS